MQDMTREEVTHFQRLDEMKLEHEHQQKLAQIQATADVEKEQIKLKQQKLRRWEEFWDADIRVALLLVLGVGTVFGVIFGIWWMWANSPIDTPEQMKQERATSCVYKNGQDDGKYDQVWYPDAAGGQGLCLPKSAPAPAGTR